MTLCSSLPRLQIVRSFELPYIQGWLEAMTSLGRLIYFDQPGTGVSDPATPTLELRADSITAVLDDLGSAARTYVSVRVEMSR